MALILLPRPRLADEGAGRWTPEPGLKELLLSQTALEPLPSGVVFTETRNGVPGSYTLRADREGIRIAASDAEGRRNALMTMRQAMRQLDERGTLPVMSIEDEPVFRERGVMLDISRTRVPTMETLFRLVDLFAELKYNRLHLYTEHTFAYAGHERVWRDASPMTGPEVERLDAYCRKRLIELVPNQNSIGHMERWLRHPEYRDIAEAPEGFNDPWGVFREHASTLDVSNPGSLEFLKSLYDQLLPHFSSRTFNVGGDEPYDLGRGRNRERCEREGTGRVYLDFLNTVVNEVLGRGRTPQIWADIVLNYPDLLDDLPGGVVLMNWGYEAIHPFEKETALLAATGRPFQVCPGTASWNSLCGRWPLAAENIREAARWGARNGADGLLVTDWGDNGHKQQYVVSMPGWFAAAAAAWNGPDGVDEDIVGALQIHLFEDPSGSEARGLLTLGALYLENPEYLHNMSWLMLPVLDHQYPYYRSQYPDIGRAGGGRAAEIARETAGVIGQDGDVWRRQLSFTALMASFAADLALPFFASSDYRIENLPESLRRGLAARLDERLEQYGGLWLEVCRPGGLEESLDGFSGLMRRLRN